MNQSDIVGLVYVTNK